MHTIRLRVNENAEFVSIQNYLKAELDKIENKNCEFISI